MAATYWGTMVCIIMKQTSLSEFLPAPIAVDLFAGAGGMSLGLIMAGIDVRVAVEYWNPAARTYWYNLCGSDSTLVGDITEPKGKNKGWTITEHNGHRFGKPVKALICRDIQRVSGQDIREAGKLMEDEIDLLCGGPPCQGFSLANTKTRGIDDPRSKMMWHFIRLVGELKPRRFTIENVRGLMSFKDFVYTLMDSLELHGYVVRINVLNAADYGVPQLRIRVFIEGCRSDLGMLPLFSIPTHADKELIASHKLAKKEKTEEKVAELTKLEQRDLGFNKNGFTKEELKDLSWHNTLGILYNKKSVSDYIYSNFRNQVLESIVAAVKVRGAQ